MQLPEFYPVQSSNVEAVAYSPESETAYVRFLNGSTYAYKGVSANAYENLRKAASVGSHLNSYFKNVYPYERVS